MKNTRYIARWVSAWLERTGSPPCQGRASAALAFAHAGHQAAERALAASHRGDVFGRVDAGLVARIEGFLGSLRA